MKPSYEELETRCAELAAENAGLKAVIAENWNMRDVLRQLVSARPGVVYFNKWEQVILKALNETPATDAIIAEVRAQGVEMLRDSIAEIEGGIEDTIDLHHYCSDFAAEVRKGVQS